MERFVADDGWKSWLPPRRHLRPRRPGRSRRTCGPDGDKSPGWALADYVHGKGLEFGLWFEPEMVNPDSDLFRAHPGLGVEAHRRPSAHART
ncbi:MAG: alpha-galactosidase [Bifidobacterium adolescentis]